MKSTTITTQNGSVHILEAGAPAPPADADRLPLVFIHGMACSADLWSRQLGSVGQTRRAIAIDLRGHGASTPPADDDYSPAACATDVFAVLEALDLERIALVGHSYGSCVALATAAARPNQIAQLVLVDPPIDCTGLSPEAYEEQIAPIQAVLASDSWRSALEESFRGALTGGTAATKDHILSRLEATPKEALLGTSRELFTFRAVEALDRYLAKSEAPVHAILAPSNASPLSLHTLRPAVNTITLPNTGHWLMLDAPEAFETALDTCLAKGAPSL